LAEPARASSLRARFPLDVLPDSLHPPRVRRLFPSLLLLLPACSNTPAAISIDITAGQETTAFSEAPAVTTVAVTITSLDGSINTTLNPAPGQAFDFGDGFDNTEQISISVAGTNSSSTQPILGGQSLSGLLLSSIEGGITVFAQRKYQWSRPWGGLAASHVDGVATVVEERFLSLSGGHAATGDTTSTATNVDTYDLFGLTGDATTPPLFSGAQTIVPIPVSSNNTDTQALFLSDSGPQLYDYTLGSADTTNAALDLPAGVTAWSDVTGGAVLSDGSGRAFVVGATRSSGATDVVLDIEVDSNGDVVLTNFPLNAKRAGAAAAYIAGVGLVVAGGSATGGGVEVLSPTGAGFVLQGGYLPINVTGAGVVTDGATNGVWLLGGVDAMGNPAPTLHLPLSSCGAGCMPDTPNTALQLPNALVGVSAYMLTNGSLLAVGNEPGGGFTRSFIVDVGVGVQMPVTEALLKEPRKGAAVIPAPNATLALLGGEHADGTPALSVELFLP